jgi:hypothetical protein
MSKLVIIHAGRLVHPNPEANNVEFNVPNAGHGIIWSDSFYENDFEISSGSFFLTRAQRRRSHSRLACTIVTMCSKRRRQLVVRDMVLHAPRLRMRIVVYRHHGSVCRDEWLCILLQFIRLLLIALSRWDQMQQDKRLEPVPIRQVVSDHGYSYAQGTR